MPSVERETLHKMVDALPEAEAAAAPSQGKGK